MLITFRNHTTNKILWQRELYKKGPDGQLLTFKDIIEWVTLAEPEFRMAFTRDKSCEPFSLFVSILTERFVGVCIDIYIDDEKFQTMTLKNPVAKFLDEDCVRITFK